MPTNAPLSAEDIVSYDILIDGSSISDSVEVESIVIERSINRIATATLVIILPFGSGDNRTFALSESADFIPGKSIVIKLGSISSKEQVFAGMIVHQSIRNRSGNLNTMVLRCSDEAVKMTAGTQSKYYDNMKDSDVISAIISDHGLTAHVEATAIQHVQLIQYQANDWDFIRTRAAANGLWVYTEDGTVSVQKPLASGSATVSVDFGQNVLEFDCGIESREQLASVSASAWDMKTQAILKSDASEPSVNAHGNLDGKTVGAAIGIGALTLATTPPLQSDELKAWADGRLLSARMSELRGNVTFFGNSSVKLNTLMTMTGFGDRFNGDALVTRIMHEVRSGYWRTTAGFGTGADHLPEPQRISAPAAGGLLPAVYGLQNGTVKKINEDPDGNFRIQVDVPVIAPSGTGIWARMSHFYATSGKGSFFLPEIGDEVVLGFLNDDPRFPVILGMLYSSKLSAPYTPDSDNSIKAIVTKNQLKIEFQDKDKVLTLSTPAGNTFILSDKDKSVTVKDQNGNKIEMTSSGIALDSPKDIVIKATGKIDLNATQNISLNSSGGDVSIAGLNVNAKANVAFSAQGNASAELKASGSTSVKGAMVMIN